MTFGDVDQMNDRALETLDEREDEPDPSELQATPNLGSRVSDRDALAIANQQEIQRAFKW